MRRAAPTPTASAPAALFPAPGRAPPSSPRDEVDEACAEAEHERRQRQPSPWPLASCACSCCSHLLLLLRAPSTGRRWRWVVMVTRRPHMFLGLGLLAAAPSWGSRSHPSPPAHASSPHHCCLAPPLQTHYTAAKLHECMVGSQLHIVVPYVQEKIKVASKTDTNQVDQSFILPPPFSNIL